MRRYFEIYTIMLRNSLIREMSFKANFILWLIVEVLWFVRADRVFQHHLRARGSDRRLVEMGSRRCSSARIRSSRSFSRRSSS